MKRRKVRERMNELAANHGFRWVRKTKRFLGVHRGIVVELSEWDGDVTFKFSAPTASLGEVVAEHFDGFRRCHDGGLPTDWITYLLERDGLGSECISDHGCVVSIDGRQIDSIGLETFEQIPDLVAEDFHSFGATETLPCTSCGQQDASIVGLLNYA